MLQELDALRDEVDSLATDLEENEQITAQIFEMLLRIKAKVDAIEEVLVHTAIVDQAAVKELEECNFLESVHILANT